MPMKVRRYHENFWRRVREAKEATGWKCESCGIAHLSSGTRARHLRRARLVSRWLSAGGREDL